MSTVIQIIGQALKDVNALGKGDTPDADDSADCLALMNQMIGQWATQKSYVYAQKVVTFAATGAQTYTIGPTGVIAMPLPAKIDSASYRDANAIDTPLQIVASLEQYELIAQKVTTGTTSALFYQRDFPLGVIYTWPQMSTGTYRMVTRVQLSQHTLLTEDMALPPEYELAVRFSLAELIAPMYGVMATPAIMRMAANSRRVMKRQNTAVPTLGLPMEVLGRYSIR